MPTRTALELDYAASFTANTAAATTATTALAVATTATWLGVPWPVVAIGGTALSAGALAVSRSRAARNKPNAVPRDLGITWALWAAEVAAALYLAPHTWTLAHYWTALAVFITTWALTYWALDRADITDEAHYAENLANDGATPADTKAKIDALIDDRHRHSIAEKWLDAINHTLGFKPGHGPTVTGLTEWDPVNGTSPGFTMTLDLPRGSGSSSFTTAVVRQLAEDSGLPNGCTITPARGTRQGQIMLNVETVDPSTITHHFPRDYSPLTIHDMLPWGASPHGSLIGPKLREKGAIIIGPPGTGKTMLLNNIISSFARCPDVLVWGIDVGKQGAAFAPWARNLPPGARPAVDAIAGTTSEALDMIQAAQRAADKRVHHYAADMKNLNTDLVPIGPSIPQIVLIFDESAELFNFDNNDETTKKAREAAIKLMRTTRQAGIRTILTFTDGNVISVGSTDILKYNPVHVALCGNGADPQGTSVSKLFGQIKGIDARQINAPGAGVANYGQGPEIHRGHLTKPDMIEECVIQTTPFRATMDDPSADALGPWYANRWTPEQTTGDDDTDTGPVNVARETPANRPAEWTATATDMGEFEAEFFGNLPTANPAPSDSTGFGWLATAAANIPTPAPEQPDRLDGWRKLTIDHLTANPHTAYSTSELLGILATTYATQIARQTLSTQLAAWANDGTITATGTGAQRTYRANTSTDPAGD